MSAKQVLRLRGPWGRAIGAVGGSELSLGRKNRAFRAVGQRCAHGILSSRAATRRGQRRVRVLTTARETVHRRVQAGRLAQLARALARHARGHWFESSTAHGQIYTIAKTIGYFERSRQTSRTDRDALSRKATRGIRRSVRHWQPRAKPGVGPRAARRPAGKVPRPSVSGYV